MYCPGCCCGHYVLSLELVGLKATPCSFQGYIVLITAQKVKAFVNQMLWLFGANRTGAHRNQTLCSVAWCDCIFFCEHNQSPHSCCRRPTPLRAVTTSSGGQVLQGWWLLNNNDDTHLWVYGNCVVAPLVACSTCLVLWLWDCVVIWCRFSPQRPSVLPLLAALRRIGPLAAKFHTRVAV